MSTDLPEFSEHLLGEQEEDGAEGGSQATIQRNVWKITRTFIRALALTSQFVGSSKFLDRKIYCYILEASISKKLKLQRGIFKLEMIELPLFIYHPKFNIKSVTSHSEQIRMHPG